MKILRAAHAGTLESSDAMVLVSPGEDGLHIQIESVVLPQFGPAIRQAAAEVAQEMCVTTPGDTVDVLITQRGIAINPKQEELKDRLTKAGLPVFPIQKLKEMAEGYTGVPTPVKPQGKVVGEVEYRDGTVIDVIRAVK